MKTETVRLNNGSDEPAGFVAINYMILQRLWNDEPAALLELQHVCQDKTYKPMGFAREILEGLGLMQSGGVNKSVRHVVLSACQGSMFDMKLVDPIDRRTVCAVITTDK